MSEVNWDAYDMAWYELDLNGARVEQHMLDCMRPEDGTEGGES